MAIQRAEADLMELEALTSRLRSELGEAEAKLVKIRAYIEMARLYGAGGSLSKQPHNTSVPTANGNNQREFGGNIGKAVAEVVEILQTQGGSIHTRVLLEMLADRGITIGGKTPVGNLSGVLSRSGKFTNSRSDGWSIKETAPKLLGGFFGVSSDDGSEPDKGSPSN